MFLAFSVEYFSKKNIKYNHKSYVLQIYLKIKYFLSSLYFYPKTLSRNSLYSYKFNIINY